MTVDCFTWLMTDASCQVVVMGATNYTNTARDKNLLVDCMDVVLITF